MVGTGKNRGFTLLELLIAMLVALLVLGAIGVLYVVSSRSYIRIKDIGMLTEDVRDAVTTLEFLFSRWGVGVPCANNYCDISSIITIPPCDSYPPTVPICMSIGNNQISFYGSLHGVGIIVDNSTMTAVSCRLKLDEPYYLLYGGSFFWNSTSNTPISCSIESISENNKDCFDGPDKSQVTLRLDCNNITNIPNGTVLIRVPHRIDLYVDGGVLNVGMVDMYSRSLYTVSLGNVTSFDIKPIGRAVEVSITFVSRNGREFKYERIFGR
ncbi:MAG: PilW family protein [Thermosulfidibacteraceae bacterium]|jgi:prepilin-type N-terminal cleavage/methylation domain-containing protein